MPDGDDPVEQIARPAPQSSCPLDMSELHFHAEELIARLDYLMARAKAIEDFLNRLGDDGMLAKAIVGIAAVLAERRKVGAPEGLSPAEAAAYLGISVAKLHAMNAAGLIPAPAELGDRCPRWTRTELRAWMQAGAPSRRTWNVQREAVLRRVG